VEGRCKWICRVECKSFFHQCAESVPEQAAEGNENCKHLEMTTVSWSGSRLGCCGGVIGRIILETKRANAQKSESMEDLKIAAVKETQMAMSDNNDGRHVGGSSSSEGNITMATRRTSMTK
jgi:hypothetical protein